MAMNSPRPGRSLVRRSAPLALVALGLLPATLRADVTGEGDVAFGGALGVPLLLEDGGASPDIIIVGGSNLPEALIPIGRLTIDNPALTLPLSSPNGYIAGLPEDAGGAQELSSDSLGLAIVTGLFSQWNIAGELSVGGFGEGYLEITAGGQVATGVTDQPGNLVEDDAYVGNGAGSQGFVTINGFGSRLTNNFLRVGFEGFGRVDVTSRGWLQSTSGAILGDQRVDADNAIGEGRVVVDGLGTRWNVGDLDGPGDQDGLIVGREGRGYVEVRNGGLVRVDSDTVLGDLANSYGEIIVNGVDSQFWTFDNFVAGGSTTSSAEIHVENEGLLRVDGTTTFNPRTIVDLAAGGRILTPTLINNGVIRGDGVIDTGVAGVVTNNSYIRNGAGLANTRERLLITGPVNNADNIESVGGEIEFQGLVTNTSAEADIVGIDAIFRFGGGLNNAAGDLYLKDSLIWLLNTNQTVTNSANLVVLEGESHILGDLTLTSTSDMSIEVGHTSSLLSIDGDVSLGGRLLVTAVDDILGSGSGDGYEPGVGDSFEIITGSSVTGAFADVDDLFADVNFVPDYTQPGRVLLNVVASLTGFDADFDNSGFVDGFDFLVWQMNRGALVATPAMGDADGDGNVDDTDYQIWEDQFGGPPPAVPAGSAVPEPTGAALALLAVALASRRRSRS